MKEILNSITEVGKTRLTNPLYGTFLFTWFVFHWNFIFAVFSIDDKEILKLTGLLKNDYLVYRYFDVGDWYFWFSWLVPFIFTYLIVWELPERVLLPAYRKSKEHETKKRIVKNEEELKVIIAVRHLEEENTKTAKVIAERAEEEKKIMEKDPTFKWEEDFLKFKETPTYYTFGDLVDEFYRGEQNTRNTILVSFLDSLGAIELAPQNPSYIMGFTDKGKYFIRRMRESK